MKLSNTTKEELLLYGVTDRAWLNGETLYSQVEKALKGGATFMQLREKKLDEESFLKEAIEIKELCRKYNVPFVINDNVDIKESFVDYIIERLKYRNKPYWYDRIRKIIQNLTKDSKWYMRLHTAFNVDIEEMPFKIEVDDLPF